MTLRSSNYDRVIARNIDLTKQIQSQIIEQSKKDKRIEELE